jgi:Ni/Fe-hydrogenase 1 B-type cytochrome subunit
MINNGSSSTTEISLHEKHSIVIRIWHWLTYFMITGALMSVFIATQVLNPRENAGLIQNKLHEKGASVTLGQAGHVAHSVTDKVWQWHTYIGYGISLLFLVRIVSEFFQARDEKFFNKIGMALRLLKMPGNNLKHNRYYLMVKIMYLGLYLTLTTIVVTGLSMAFGDQLGLSKETRHSLHEVHGFCMYLVLAFVASHIAGWFTMSSTPIRASFQK